MPTTPGVTITGKLEDLTGSNNAGKLAWTLVNYGSFLPEISGTMVLAEVTVSTQAAADGTFSQALWGNYQLQPSNTFYQLVVFGADGTQVVAAAFQFNAGGSFDLSTLSPVAGTSPPIFIAPAIISFNGRTGVVVPANGDYSFSQISGSVAAAQLPNPTASTLGGTESFAAVTHQFLTSISTSGVPAAAQPAFTDISGAASTAQVPSLAASKITSGQIALAQGGTGVDLSATGGTTKIIAQDASHVISARDLVAGDIPSLAASKITTGQVALAQGGTNADLSATGGTSQVLKQATVGGNVTVAQLAFTDISGTAAAAQYVSMVGDSGSGGTKGAAPAPPTGSAAAGKFLKADGTWAVPPGSGGTSYTVVSKVANYTAASGDDVWCNGTFTITLPAAGTTARVKISNQGAGAITVSPASGTIKGNASMVLGTQYSSVELSSDGTNWAVE